MGKSRRSYRVEWIALAVVALGVALLVDWTPVMALVDSFIVGVARQLTFATLLGLVLVCGGVVFIAWRGRVRFLSSPYWRATVCPRCGSPIHRVHRSPLDKTVSKVLLPHARRYCCEQAECGWTGLRHSRRYGREQLTINNPGTAGQGKCDQ
jgi:hypothetical protein